MRYLSVCSGIEAATVAWKPLGWECVGVSEIDPFCCELLKHHYPTVMNYGSLLDHERWDIEPGTVTLLAGGTPCQAFSTLGERKGLDDLRSGLAIEYLRLARRLRPRWILWENVCGALHSNGGRDLGTFLRNLGDIGYGWCYRVLDARYFGVAQSRRRIFLVGFRRNGVGDWRYPAAVLHNAESLRGDRSPQPPQGHEIVGCLTARGGVACCNIAAEQGQLRVGANGIPRRLVPIEWERLMGFPDGYTNIPSATDSKRYKALGNSWCVPVARWVGRRIQAVNDMIHSEELARSLQ